MALSFSGQCGGLARWYDSTEIDEPIAKAQRSVVEARTVAAAVLKAVAKAGLAFEVGQIPDWMTSYLPTRLGELSQLAPDWDSYGGLAISKDVFESTLTLLAELAVQPQPEIEASPLGAVVAEWDSGDDFVAITVRPSHVLDLEWHVQDDEGEQQIHTANDMDRARDLLGVLHTAT